MASGPCSEGPSSPPSFPAQRRMGLLATGRTIHCVVQDDGLGSGPLRPSDPCPLSPQDTEKASSGSEAGTMGSF